MLDGMGVLFPVRDQVLESLVPFCARRGGRCDVGLARDVYVACTLGHCSTTALWRSLGTPGAPLRLDRDYVLQRRLRAGALPLLRRLRALRTSIAVVSNDTREWSLLARRVHGFETMVDTFTTSADVGVRKPTRGIYEAFLDASGARPDRTFFVDDRPENLETADEVGFRTVLFDPCRARRGPWTTASSFADLLALVTSAV